MNETSSETSAIGVMAVSESAAVSEGIVRIVASARGEQHAVDDVLAALRPAELTGIVAFCSGRDALEAFTATAQRDHPGVAVIGCTTAGEITPWGTQHGGICALGFPASDFTMKSVRFDGLPGFDPFAAHRTVAELVGEAALASAHLGPRLARVGLMLIDGLSCREELLTHTMHHLLEDIPVIGGSAADAIDFRRTFVAQGGAVRGDSAVLAVITSRRPMTPLRCHHHRAGEKLAVITHADPAARVVHELNGEAAAAEYARLIGIAPDRLDDRALAAHPMMIRVGGEYYARAPVRVTAAGSLVFQSAIERGLVLRLGHSTGLLESLAAGLADCGEPDPDAVIAFSSVQNWIEAEAGGLIPELDELYRRHRFAGFNTYGEQYRDLHLNRSFLGLAIGKAVL